VASVITEYVSMKAQKEIGVLLQNRSFLERLTKVPSVAQSAGRLLASQTLLETELNQVSPLFSKSTTTAGEKARVTAFLAGVVYQNQQVKNLIAKAGPLPEAEFKIFGYDWKMVLLVGGGIVALGMMMRR